MESKQILKDLHAVLTVAKARYSNEYVWQEFKLSEQFKLEYKNILVKKKWAVEYYEYTTVITTSEGQYIVVPNQWFALASYFVDFCTEILTYRSYFEKVRKALGYKGNDTTKYATYLRTAPTHQDRQLFIKTAQSIFEEEFPTFEETEHATASKYLWNFVNDYKWWDGSKTVERNDFYISPILSKMKVVNANAEYLAIITQTFASSLKLRMLTDNLAKFMVDAQTKVYVPSELESASYEKAEALHKESYSDEPFMSQGISISAASLERFHQTC